MRSRKHWLCSMMGIAALTLGGAALTGCDDDAENAGEEVGESLDRAGENIKDATRDAGDKIEDAAD